MVEYAPVRQLLEMTCHNCHTKKLIDPTNQSDVQSIEDWLKVQRSSGETFAYCSVSCLQKGSHNIKASGLITP